MPRINGFERKQSKESPKIQYYWKHKSDGIIVKIVDTGKSTTTRTIKPARYKVVIDGVSHTRRSTQNAARKEALDWMKGYKSRV